MSTRFLNKLKSLGYSTNSKNYYSVGSNTITGLTNFYKIFGNTKLPSAYSNKCICDTKIKTNFYLHNTISDKIIVVGNCCKKKFILKSQIVYGKCKICASYHKNRSDNFCNICRKDYVLQFGKYKGFSIFEVNHEYLRWITNNVYFTETLHQNILKIIY